MTDSSPTFWKQAAQILNAGQARSLMLTGNIYDLYRVETDDPPSHKGSGVAGDEIDYVPIVQALIHKWDLPRIILVVYELNGPVRFVNEDDKEKVRDAWLKWRTGMDSNDLAIKRMLSAGKVKTDLELTAETFDINLDKATGRPTTAFELLRQMCLCSRTEIGGKPCLESNLIVIIESADFALPDSPIDRMSTADRQRVSICQDWFSDPGFTEGKDSVVLLAESRSMIHHRIAQLPQVLDVEVPAPDTQARHAFINWFNDRQPEKSKIKIWGSKKDLATATAGLSIHALRQMLKGVAYSKDQLTRDDAVAKVEEFIKSQMGEDVVEFKKPSHTLEDVIGFSDLKVFLDQRLIPRFRSSDKDALPGAAVCGPIGGGKTFIFEAVASELDMVVLVLKNIRSQWYGQTDVVFERLRRVLLALDKVLIFVDEADTQFGGVGAEAHATERRLTGKIQAMMSDTQLRGRVLWLLMTARIHLLSPDIRRPGRVGDLIIPILDPQGDDRLAFLTWMVKPALDREPTEEELDQLEPVTQGMYSAAYASLRSELKARSTEGPIEFGEVLAVIRDQLSPDIGLTRRYQILQAMLNCTRRSLLPNPDVTEDERHAWAEELQLLEAKGIR